MIGDTLNKQRFFMNMMNKLTLTINSRAGVPQVATASLIEASLFFLLDGGDNGPPISSSYDNSAVSIVVSTCSLVPLRFDAGVREPSGGVSVRSGGGP